MRQNEQTKHGNPFKFTQTIFYTSPHHTCTLTQWQQFEPTTTDIGHLLEYSMYILL